MKTARNTSYLVLHHYLEYAVLHALNCVEAVTSCLRHYPMYVVVTPLSFLYLIVRAIVRFNETINIVPAILDNFFMEGCVLSSLCLSVGILAALQ